MGTPGCGPWCAGGRGGPRRSAGCCRPTPCWSSEHRCSRQPPPGRDDEDGGDLAGERCEISSGEIGERGGGWSQNGADLPVVGVVVVMVT